MERVVDRCAGDAADLQKIAAVRKTRGKIVDLLFADLLIINHHAIGTGFRDNAVEGDDDDIGIASRFHGAIQRIRRGRVEHDRIITLQDQILHLRGLGGNLLVRGREQISRGNHLVGDRLLADLVPILQHLLAP